MKLFVILSVLIAGAMAQGMYPDKYDNINVDEIIRNKKLLSAYTACLLDIKPCRLPEMRFLRDNIAEAIQTDCAKCTQKQREGTEKIIRHFIKNDPDTWKKLQDKYDPKRIYTHKYEDRIQKLA